MYSSFEILGTLCMIVVGFQILRLLSRIIYDNYLAILLKVNAVNFNELGKWAVVTGATDGIGKAYAELLAQKGKNVVLISRSCEKLESVAKEIGTKYNVETKTISVDFTDTEKPYIEVDKQLLDLDIGILINNVGMSYSYPEYFLDVKNGEELFRKMLYCNIFSVTFMTKIILPRMVERKRGVIVNVSSSAAQLPSPLLTVYSACKAFVEKFSEDLLVEYAYHGIVIQCLMPGYVATKMSKIKKSTWMAPSPTKYVNEALKTVGVLESTTGYFPHTLLVGVVNTMGGISNKFSRWVVLKTMKNIRSRAVKRQAH